MKRVPIIRRTEDGGWIEWQLTDVEDLALRREMCGLGPDDDDPEFREEPRGEQDE